MAGRISAYVTPGTLQLVDKKGSAKLAFTKPRDATDVSIQFFEVDSWVSNGKTVTESDAKPRLIGTIGGLMQHGLFKQTSQVIPFPQGPVTALLTVDIDKELITMPMPNVDNEKELDFFEVSFKITGVVGGVADTYESPTPLFVRRTSTPRAEVAFIAGDAGDFADDPPTIRYFELATRFWNSLRDNLSNERSLAGIVNFLRDDDPAIVQKRKDLPWGRVNIVSHGNEDTWFIRAHIGDTDTTAFSAQSLAAEDLGVLGPPRRKEVDENTEIIIRGCDLGLNTPLLNAIRDKFGGRATVFAPKFDNNYRLEDGAVRDRLFQSWFFSLPGSRDFPPAPEIVPILKKKYAGHPLYGSFSDADWQRVAAINAPFGGGGDAFRQRLRFRNPSDPSDTVSAEFEKEEVSPGGKPKDQTELTKLMRSQMADQIAPDEFDRFAWTWTVTQKPGSKPPIFVVSGSGTRTSFEIFRLLTKQEDGRTVPVTPNHLDPALFGRST